MYMVFEYYISDDELHDVKCMGDEGNNAPWDTREKAVTFRDRWMGYRKRDIKEDDLLEETRNMLRFDDGVFGEVAYVYKIVKITEA
jgi:hypothetical protein